MEFLLHLDAAEAAEAAVSTFPRCVRGCSAAAELAPLLLHYHPLNIWTEEEAGD